MQSSHMLQTATVVFDDERVAVNAGVGLVSLLLTKLGIEQCADQMLTKGYRPGRKLATVVAGMALGADSIDDVGVLRAGSTERVLASKAMAPETVGQWLRSMSWGHTLQLNRVLEHSIHQAWNHGAGPGGESMVIDFDSSVCTVYGQAKEGASWAYNGEYGYHPLLATRAETGEMLNARLREGSANTARAAASFIIETVNRARRCGASGEIVVRADSAFYQEDIARACAKLDVRYSISARKTSMVMATIEAIPESAWRPIDYAGGVAHVAEALMPEPWHRLIVRRVRNIDHSDSQQQLFIDYKYIPIVTDRYGDIVELDRELYGHNRYTDTLQLDKDHRKRAVQELAIRDLKDGPLAHFPSGNFNANNAWLILACLAHNTLRWIANLGLGHQGLIVARTMRYRLLTIPARITRSARKTLLHMPARWPWTRDFLTALRRLRSLTIKPY